MIDSLENQPGKIKNKKTHFSKWNHLSHNQSPVQNGRPRTMLQELRRRPQLLMAGIPLLTFTSPGFDCGSPPSANHCRDSSFLLTRQAHTASHRLWFFFWEQQLRAIWHPVFQVVCSGNSGTEESQHLNAPFPDPWVSLHPPVKHAVMVKAACPYICYVLGMRYIYTY